jgi:MFS family permease
VFCLLSTIASYIVVAAMKFENNKMIHSAQGATTTMFAAFGRAVIPREGDSILRTLIGLPPAFYLAVLGNKAINFFFNTFSLFSTVIYIERFGLSASQASLATGLATLLAGLLSPFVGLGTDKFGKRSRLLAFASGVGLLAFLVLATTNDSAVVWVGTALLAVLNSFVDTGLVTIPMIAGRSHAGVAYGVYGILGNTVDALISFVAGVILDSGENGSVTFIWFSVGVMLMGVSAWIGVCVLESRMSFIETPLDQIVETRNEHLFLATLSGVAGEDRPHSD